jgi:thioredoxin 1
MTKHFTDANFEQEVIEASKEKPVLVDFFASWCGPCIMQAPIIDELANEIGDSAHVGKLDTEESGMTAMRYGVMSIPTLLVFRNGQVVKQMVGLQSKVALAAELQAQMAN